MFKVTWRLKAMYSADVKRKRCSTPSDYVKISESVHEKMDPKKARVLDPESAAWVDALEDARGPRYEQACTRMYELLVRMAMSEAFRRGPRYRVSHPDLDDLAYEAAADALMGITRKVHEFRGDAKFTTWIFRFVVLEVSNKLSRRFSYTSRTWLDSNEWAQVPDHSSIEPVNHAQARELIEAVREAVDSALSSRQRLVFTALVNGVPLETLASEMKTNRNALYKTMFDARRKLRAHLVASGHLSASG
jgi:RNA polymerase sigma factor (sigma-70 family)